MWNSAAIQLPHFFYFQQQDKVAPRVAAPVRFGSRPGPSTASISLSAPHWSHRHPCDLVAHVWDPQAKGVRSDSPSGEREGVPQPWSPSKRSWARWRGPCGKPRPRRFRGSWQNWRRLASFPGTTACCSPRSGIPRMWHGEFRCLCGRIGISVAAPSERCWRERGTAPVHPASPPPTVSSGSQTWCALMRQSLSCFCINLCFHARCKV